MKKMQMPPTDAVRDKSNQKGQGEREEKRKEGRACCPPEASEKPIHHHTHILLTNTPTDSQTHRGVTS